MQGNNHLQQFMWSPPAQITTSVKEWLAAVRPYGFRLLYVWLYTPGTPSKQAAVPGTVVAESINGSNTKQRVFIARVIPLEHTFTELSAAPKQYNLPLFLTSSDHWTSLCWTRGERGLAAKLFLSYANLHVLDGHNTQRHSRQEHLPHCSEQKAMRIVMAGTTAIICS